MPQITLKKGDTTPEFTAELAGPEPAQELDGSESVRFYMQAPAAKGEGTTGGDLIVNQPISSVDYATAPPTVTYDFGAGETSRVGTHLAEVVVTYADGEVQSWPENQYYTVEIAEPVNREIAPAELDAPDITVGVVSADQVSAPTLQAVETLSGSITGGKTLSNFEGAGLDIDAEGDLNVANTVDDTPSHYNPIYDSDSDGTIDADVANGATTTGSLSVGGSDPLTSLPYSDGDKVLIDNARTSNGELTTTSTTFTNAYYNVNNTDLLSGDIAQQSNFSTYYIRLMTTLRNKTAGESATHRLIDHPTATVTLPPGFGSGLYKAISDFVEIAPDFGISNFNTEMKCTGGTGEVFRSNIQLIGEL